MIAPTVNPKDCTIQVFWVEPDQRGSSITQYQVTVRPVRSQLEYKVNNCGYDVDDRSCNIERKHIDAKKTVDFSRGMLVKIKALNSEGWSEDSKWSDSVRFPTVPKVLK